jgi:protein-S-isoprenylcysteine O-methyltransferase Ste14
MSAEVTRRQLRRDSWQRLGEVVPEMQRRWCVVVVMGGAALATGGALLLGARVARAGAAAAVFVEGAFVLWMGLCMYAGFWRHRSVYRARYGAAAYRHLFFRFLVPFLAGASAALYFPLCVDGRRFLPPAVAYSLAAYLLVSMQLIERRGAQIFWDFEWRAFVYNVFPERGRIVTAGIFRWLRHPVYSAGMRFSLALGLLRNNRTAILCVILFTAALWQWANVEERDLMQRDATYARYRLQVPAFFTTRPLRFWRFLVIGDGQPKGAPR